MKTIKSWPFWVIMLLLLLVTIFALTYPTAFTNGGVIVIISAVIGVAITIIITEALLSNQSDTEGQKDKNLKVYEEKLKIYKEFLYKLNEIVKGGQISDDDVKELIFQTSYIAMHTSSERVAKIVSQLKITNDIIKNSGKNGQLAGNILEIVLVLKKELYSEKNRDDKNNDEFSVKIFDDFDTFITDTEKPTSEMEQISEITVNDKIELQTYFWTELTKQLKSINPKYSSDWTVEKIKEDVGKYYSKARNRHRYFGIEFDVYQSVKPGRSVNFRIEMENEYYYGFVWSDRHPSIDDELSQILKQVSPKYKSNWWRYPDYSNDATRHDLNFWKFYSHTGMKRFIDKSQREQLVKEIAEEIDGQIKEFIKIAKGNNL